MFIQNIDFISRYALNGTDLETCVLKFFATDEILTDAFLGSNHRSPLPEEISNHCTRMYTIKKSSKHKFTN